MLFTGNSADRGGAVFAAGAASVELLAPTFVGQVARLGGALHITDGPLTLAAALSAADRSTAGAAVAWLERVTLDAADLFATDSTSDAGAGALQLTTASGTFTDTTLEAAASSYRFGDGASLVAVTGGSAALTLDRWRISSGRATTALHIAEPAGSLRIHDLEIGFHAGANAMILEATSPSSVDLENIWLHHTNPAPTAAGAAMVVDAIVTFTADWSIRQLTISDSNANVGPQLELRCHLCGALALTDSLIEGPFGGSAVRWTDTIGELDVDRTHTLAGAVWDHYGPIEPPPSCTDCTTTSGVPWVAAPPSYDVRLDPASPLSGRGDAAACAGSTAPDCADPGFWGGPLPPAPR